MADVAYFKAGEHYVTQKLSSVAVLGAARANVVGQNLPLHLLRTVRLSRPRTPGVRLQRGAPAHSSGPRPSQVGSPMAPRAVGAPSFRGSHA